ncbi:MAG: nucleotidyltransferase substrate binding protein [Oscillospiraceae bacterium]|nr:nucleotidyltransferase substrate binding protein [Oscillospiraceae bacterium]
MLRCAVNFEKTLAYAISIEDSVPVTCGRCGDSDSESSDDLFMYRFARSAVIHVFEITVESACKMMQHWIKINADINIAQKPKRELFRIARDSGLIEDAESWWGLYDARNITSHTYHEETAKEVYTIAKTFNGHIKEFIERLEGRL